LFGFLGNFVEDLGMGLLEFLDTLGILGFKLVEELRVGRLGFGFGV